MTVTKGQVRLIAVVVACTIIASNGVGVILATTPPPSASYIRACTRADGTLYVIGAGQSCPTGEQQLQWDIQGPVGPQGPQGSAGTQGPQGPAGPRGTTGPRGATGPQGKAGKAGVSGWTKVEASVQISSGDYRVVSATCPSGKKVLGGGFLVDAQPSNVRVLVSEPSSTTDAGWEVGAVNSGTTSVRLYVRAICASVS